MGYTHYFYQQRDFSAIEWQQVQAAFRRLLDNLPQHSTNAGGYFADRPLVLRGWDGNGQPECTFNAITFNGDADGDLGHETFTMTRQKESDFDFCKTARKPYDLAVCAMLLIANQIAPGVYVLGTDARSLAGDEWQPAIELANEIMALVVA